MQTLETTRLILRDLALTDLDDFYFYASNKEVATSSGWLPHKSKEESLEILTRLVNNHDNYAIVNKADNKMIGTVGVHNYSLDFQISNKKQLCLGYSLNKDYWSRGLMTEALLAVIDHCFSDLEVDILWASHVDNNKYSLKLLEQIGFVFTHRYYKTTSDHNKTYEALAYTYKREDYYARD